MRQSLARLLEGAIDYAGTFPPARLTLKETVGNYLRYRDGEDGWIMDRLVCPVGSLSELGGLLREAEPDPPAPITVIGSPAKGAADWKDALAEDRRSIAEFESEFEGLAELEAMETRLPNGCSVEEAIRALDSFESQEVFLEIPWTDGMQNALAELAEEGGIGAKARTGGPDASAYPDPATLAAFLRDALDMQVPFKLTAGLHDPIRHRIESVGAMAHGFLNVFTAAALHVEHDLTEREIASVLETEDPAAFAWRDDGFAWRGLSAGMEAIDEARDLFAGFGSCSVKEPLDGLAALGLLEAAQA